MYKFSLITICLNPGNKLRMTLESAMRQSFTDFELIIKDGGSKDGSLDTIQDFLQDDRVRLFEEKDKSIYDAMNQAVSHAQGEYVFFLNCGDVLHDENVLARVAAEEEKLREASVAVQRRSDSNDLNARDRWILYGNIYSEKTKTQITPPSQITGFTCYRNIPCHQACFYATSLCREKPFETKYKIRGDYEHFLWCFYRGNAKMQYMDTMIAIYEGGGYSETKENLKRSKREHKEITQKYMGKAELFKYRAIMAVTLAPIRTWIAENPRLSKGYQKLVRKLYRN